MLVVQDIEYPFGSFDVVVLASDFGEESGFLKECGEVGSGLEEF